MSGAPTVVQRRIAVMALTCVLAFALITLRLLDLTLLRHSPANPSLVVRHFVAGRADIVDRNGDLLARDLIVHDAMVEPARLSDKTTAAHALSQATSANEGRLLQEFARRKKPNQFVLVARQLTPQLQDRLTQLNIPGLEFDPVPKRYYPQGEAALQILGQTDSDGKGVTGIELGLDKQLRSGRKVQLSLDMRVQYALFQEVEGAMNEFNARAAGGIVMNVNTGEVLGMLSLHDPNAPPDAQDGGNPNRNRMLRDVYELGSVFKIFAFTLAMQDRTVRLEESFPIGRGFKVGRFVIHDAERMPATLTARDVLAQSSNAGTAQIALRSGPSRQQEFLRSLGLLSRVHSEDPEGAKPLYPRHWGQTETATVAFGHGISVSPFSFVTAAATVVNGGRKITPTFLKRNSDARGGQVISPEASEAMRGLLRYVVTNGTGKLADVPGYNVGGKTGSAEKSVRGRYVAHKLLTSFCAVFPIESPRYVVFVLLDEPHGANASGVMALAGHTAAPLAGRVVAKIAPMLELPADGSLVAEAGSAP